MINGIPPEDGGKAVVLFSAGKDSATSLEIARHNHDEAIPLFLHFGTEEAAVNLDHVKEYFDSSLFEVMHLEDLMFPSFVRDQNMRQGVLNESLDRDGDLEDDVPYLPMRSLAIGTCLAIAGDRLDADYLYWSFHQDEPLASLDESVEALPVYEQFVQMTAPPGYNPVLVNPLGGCEDGADVVRLGLLHHVPWEKTRSCLRTEGAHCWECVSCQDRIEAFEKAGIEDPCYDG